MLDIWEIDINDNNIKIAQHYKNILSNTELYHMHKFKFFKDYSKYLVTHVTMRLLISKYINIKPEEISYSYGKYGKPSISQNFHFNLSHTYKKALIGFYKKEIGVDIEYKKDIENYYDIEDLVYTKEESNYVKEGNRKSRFYEVWTKKEAMLKAIGVGLNEDIKNLSIVKNSCYYKNHIWQITQVKSDPNYVAHIAYKNNDVVSNLNYFIWNFQQ